MRKPMNANSVSFRWQGIILLPTAYCLLPLETVVSRLLPVLYDR
jgi:hypothetical protein